MTDSNSNLRNAAQMAVSMAQNSAISETPILKSPFRSPKTIKLIGAIPQDSTKTYFFIDDAVGLASNFQRVSTGATAGLEFTSQGASITNIKEYLKTNALVISGYNFNSTDPAQTSNNVQPIWTNLDGTGNNDILFSSLEVSNMQYNPNLLNVRDQPFVWTNQTALQLPATANVGTGGTITNTLTFIIRAAVPYAKLDEFLMAARIPSVNGCTC